MADRKPLIILAVVVVVAIALFVVGVVGVGRRSTGGGWPDWASTSSTGDQLIAADLRGGDTCDIEGPVISFVGACVVEVLPVTGGFPWQQVTRRAQLTAGPEAPVGLTVTLAGKTLHTNLDPGKGVRLTYTREGGTFALTCASATGCAVVLSKDA